MHVQTLTTDGCVPQKRVEYWNAVTSAILITQIAEPADPQTFRGRLRSAKLGQLRLAELSASASTVIHTRSHIAQSSESPFLLRLPLIGHVSVLQGSGDMYMRAGDYSLCDSSRPYKLVMSDDCVVFTVCIPRDRLSSHIAIPEAVTSIVMSGAQGAGKLTSNFLMQLWTMAATLLEPDAPPRFENIALQVIAASYAPLVRANIPRSSFAVQHRLAIRQYIEGHLTDPELTPRTIAKALRITPGYAHRTFSGEDDSIARFILRRRLEECARALRDPLLAVQGIMDIAFARGFNSAAHFAKVFREQYRMSARDYRLASLGPLLR